jgi:hypothetical protein
MEEMACTSLAALGFAEHDDRQTCAWWNGADAGNDVWALAADAWIILAAFEVVIAKDERWEWVNFSIVEGWFSTEIGEGSFRGEKRLDVEWSFGADDGLLKQRLAGCAVINRKKSEKSFHFEGSFLSKACSVNWSSEVLKEVAFLLLLQKALQPGSSIVPARKMARRVSG